MQSNQLILVSSFTALVLCAVPYGCAGKSEGSDPNGKPQADGKTHSEGSLSHSDGMRGDGGISIAGRGATSDGSPGDGGIARDGIPVLHGDGWDPDRGDGWSETPDGPSDGWNDSADGHADGWSDSADGNSDGSP